MLSGKRFYYHGYNEPGNLFISGDTTKPKVSGLVVTEPAFDGTKWCILVFLDGDHLYRSLDIEYLFFD